MQLAEEPEMRDMLKSAIAAVLGFAPAFRFQLGRGSVRPDEGPDPASRAASLGPTSDDGPPPEYYETAVGMVEPGIEARATPNGAVDVTPGYSAGAAPKSELERLLTEELGGRIVGEHAAPSASGDDDAGDIEDEETAGPGQEGPGLFDNDGED